MPLNRETVATGTPQLPALTDYVGSYVLFCMEGATKEPIETKFGTEPTWECELIVVPEDGSSFESVGKVAVFQQVISRALDEWRDGKETDQTTDDFVAGKLIRSGRAYLLEAIPNDAAHKKVWAMLDKAADSFEPFPEED